MMGVCYKIGCTKCKVVRDLDKLNPCEPQNSKEAIEYGQDLNTYRASLLIGFLSEHETHPCILVNDTLEEEYEEILKYDQDDKDYWTSP
jgi:hypothetical protein